MKRVSNVVVAGAAGCGVRGYVPIFSPDAPSDFMEGPRMQDQMSLLWGAEAPSVASVDEGVRYLRQVGINPILQELPAGDVSIISRYAEDHSGANLAYPANKAHFSESLAYWTRVYEAKYSNTMRLFRRTASQHVGSLNGKDVLVDEADAASTKWADDTYFRELSFLANNFLKEHCSSMEELEIKLRDASPEAYHAFMSMFRYQTLTMIPLPSPSSWYYEGDALKAWIEKWKPLQAEAIQGTVSKMQAAAGGWKEVAVSLADQFAKIYAVVQEREARQHAAGIVKPFGEMNDNERIAHFTKVVQDRHDNLVKGDFEGDTLDASDDCLQEQTKIAELLAEPLPGLDFTAEDFVKHVLAPQAIEFEHLVTAHSFKVLQGRALAVIRTTTTPEKFYADIVDSIRNSTVDPKNGSFIPHMNDTWCKLNWVKFGASSIVHHTAAARRELLFHHATLKGVKASATLFYKLLPLSSSLDYRTPYTFRKSYVACCADYGVSVTQDQHASSTAPLVMAGSADVVASKVVHHVKATFGASRRSTYAEKRKARKGFLPDTAEKARVLPLNAADDEASSARDEQQWALGSARSVSFKYDSPHITRLRQNPLLGLDKILSEVEGTRKVGIEVALVRRVSKERAESLKAASASASTELGQVVSGSSQLSLLRSQTVQFCQQLTGRGDVSADLTTPVPTPQEGEWEFVTMLNDNAHPQVDETTIDVTMPFCIHELESAPLITRGEYALRLRFFDNTENVAHIPTNCTEAITAPFELFNGVPEVLSRAVPATDKAAVATIMAGRFPEGSATPTISGKKLIPVCAALRDAGIEVPLDVEFSAGQWLTPKGEVPLPVLLGMLTRNGKYTPMGLNGQVRPKSVTDVGLTQKQLEVEPELKRYYASAVLPGMSDEEWAGIRRYALEDALSTEAEWWRCDNWTHAPMTADTQASRTKFVREVCTVLAARNSVGEIHPRKIAATAAKERTADPFGASVSLNGDGTLGELSLNASLVRGSDASLQGVLDAIKDSVDDARLRLNALAGAKRAHVQRHHLISCVRDANSTVLGGKYASTTQFALETALRELRHEGSSATIEGMRRDLKPVDRFASSDNYEQRKNMWDQGVNYAQQPSDELRPDAASQWGTQ